MGLLCCRVSLSELYADTCREAALLLGRCRALCSTSERTSLIQSPQWPTEAVSMRWRVAGSSAIEADASCAIGRVMSLETLMSDAEPRQAEQPALENNLSPPRRSKAGNSRAILLARTPEETGQQPWQQLAPSSQYYRSVYTTRTSMPAAAAPCLPF